MTVQQYWQSLSQDDKARVKRYYDSIQPFEVLPSPTLEFDGEFAYKNGEPIWAEINLFANLEIDDMFCTCGAGGCCVHLAAMMYDMVERGTVFVSKRPYDRDGAEVNVDCHPDKGMQHLCP